MGEKSSVTINTPGKASLKTTIPISMVRQFGINQGDQLDWSVAKFGESELVMVVRKDGQKYEQNIIPYRDVEEERERNIQGEKKGKKQPSRPTVA
jgi:bifunctional DNA-binding transcriptional regulator/antitoxin component of YhaV-PrlF toxin-antitoxin module